MRWKFQKKPSIEPLLWSGKIGFLWMAKGLACLSAAWVIAQVVWWLGAPSGVAARTSPFPTLADQQQRVAARHFFGVLSASTPDPAGAEPISHEAPSTPWRLQGTYVGDSGRAILTAEGRYEVVIAKVGDHLSSGHEVVDVLPESVVLSKQGQRSELVLRPPAQEGPGNWAPDNRFGNSGPPPSNKDSR